MRVDSDKDHVPVYEPFVAGGITGFCTAFVLCPSDVLKCRSQLSRAKGLALPLRAIFAQTIKHEGLMGLYTGTGDRLLYFAARLPVSQRARDSSLTYYSSLFLSRTNNPNTFLFVLLCS